MGLVLFFAMMGIAGREIARRVLARDDAPREGMAPREGVGTSPFERAVTTALFTLAIAVALSWALALPKLLTREGLLVGATLVAACAIAAGRRQVGEELAGLVQCARDARTRAREALRREVDAETLSRLAMIAGVLALVATFAFFLWRSATILTPNHDGAAYHLPRAAMFVRAHGYGSVDSADMRLARWPCNYELLLADAMLLDGSDVHTGWVSVAALVLFLLGVAALAERWWGRGRHVLVAVLLAAAMPVVLLHADTHKNDVLTAALFVTAITFAARAASEWRAAPLVVALTSVALALGTKGSTLFLIAALGPLAIGGCVRHRRAGGRFTLAALAAWCGIGAGLFLALGGTVYVRNAIETGSPFGTYPRALQSSYGDWGNLFQFTYLAFARPFSASAESVWVPWRHAYWHWERYDLYLSEWGLPASLLLFALPFGVARYARRAPACAASVAERVSGSLVFLLAFLLILPIHFVPAGFFASFVRYTLFFPLVIMMWTAVPAIAELDARDDRWRFGAAAGLLASVGVFGWYVAHEVTRDLLQPLDYVLAIAAHPEQRRTRRSAWNNSAVSLVDRVAGPDDVIALDGGWDSASYYCYGAELRRGVVTLHPERGSPVAIPSEAKWVVVDRVDGIVYGDPSFHDFGDWNEHFMKGKPTREELVVFDQLSRDPHFKLVYRYPEMNQAIFERVSP